MNSEVLIRVDGVSKKFCHRHKRSLWYGAQDIVHELLGCVSSQQELRRDEFWAVDAVSFEVRRGECLGLIGDNGGGKTTLLKMLMGLIKPDRGRIEIRGRMSAVLALGAGFNPILTGRENIYMMCAVLGLSRAEVRRKIDEIIDFSEIGYFADAPVQNYSSGMRARLGFAIATAVEPDVLLLDEVLAVGDSGFRAKCHHRLGGLLDSAGVIFVSHIPSDIRRVCDAAMWLKHGRRIAAGPPDMVLAQYAANGDKVSGNSPGAFDSGVFHVEMDSVSENVEYGGNLELRVGAKISRSVHCDQAYLNIVGQAEELHAQVILRGLMGTMGTGVAGFRIVVGPLFLSRGQYKGSLLLWTSGGREMLVELRNCFSFRSDGPMRVGDACYYPASTVEILHTSRNDAAIESDSYRKFDSDHTGEATPCSSIDRATTS